MGADWRKPSRSVGNGACVEAGNAPGRVLVRDSKDRDGLVPAFGAGAWRVFTDGLRGEVEQQINEAVAKDEAVMRTDPSKAPLGALMTALVIGGRDTALQACPVLAVRLRSADGQKVAEGVRSMMQGWEES